jgi:hypothetical protein
MFTIGSDPEVFVYDKETGEIIDPCIFTQGTKENPEPCGIGFIQADGMALEFNTPPAENKEEFITFVTSMINSCRELVQNVHPNLDIKFDPVVHFDKEIPAHAKQLGCDPDFNSSGNMNPKPNIEDEPVRTGSGHIHIGWDGADKNDFLKRLEIANKVTPHVLNKAVWENDLSEERRKYYGFDNSFRPKNYGVELRAFDNTWLQSPDHIGAIYDLVMEALNESQV